MNLSKSSVNTLFYWHIKLYTEQLFSCVIPIIEKMIYNYIKLNYTEYLDYYYCLIQAVILLYPIIKNFFRLNFIDFLTKQKIAPWKAIWQSKKTITLGLLVPCVHCHRDMDSFWDAFCGLFAFPFLCHKMRVLGVQQINTKVLGFCAFLWST